jgi:hypothetical protein
VLTTTTDGLCDQSDRTAGLWGSATRQSTNTRDKTSAPNGVVWCGVVCCGVVWCGVLLPRMYLMRTGLRSWSGANLPSASHHSEAIRENFSTSSKSMLEAYRPPDDDADDDDDEVEAEAEEGEVAELSTPNPACQRGAAVLRLRTDNSGSSGRGSDGDRRTAANGDEDSAGRRQTAGRHALCSSTRPTDRPCEEAPRSRNICRTTRRAHRTESDNRGLAQQRRRGNGLLRTEEKWAVCLLVFCMVV